MQIVSLLRKTWVMGLKGIIEGEKGELGLAWGGIGGEWIWGLKRGIDDRNGEGGIQV